MTCRWYPTKATAGHSRPKPRLTHVSRSVICATPPRHAPSLTRPTAAGSQINPAQDGAALDTHGGLGATTFQWGDGTTSYGGSTSGEGRGRATHTYNAARTYTIVGTVTDSSGRTSTY